MNWKIYNEESICTLSDSMLPTTVVKEICIHWFGENNLKNSLTDDGKKPPNGTRIGYGKACVKALKRIFYEMSCA